MIRKKILSAVDKTFIHHGEYTAALPARNFTGSKYQKLFFTSIKGKPQYAVDFLTNSATEPGVKHYHQYIALLRLGELLRDKKPMLMRDRVQKAISEGDLLVTCQCPAQLYWGYMYIDTKMGIAFPGYEEKRYPKIRNVRLQGVICKHLALVLSVIVFNTPNILRDLKKKELE